jgi:hypothetical protein
MAARDEVPVATSRECDVASLAKLAGDNGPRLHGYPPGRTGGPAHRRSRHVGGPGRNPTSFANGGFGQQRRQDRRLHMSQLREFRQRIEAAKAPFIEPLRRSEA